MLGRDASLVKMWIVISVSFLLSCTNADDKSDHRSDGSIDGEATIDTGAHRESDGTGSRTTTDSETDTGDIYLLDTEPIPQIAPCSTFDDGSSVGTLFSGVDEVSGVVASRIQTDVLWVHEDAGNSPFVYAIRADGTLLGKWLVAADSPIEDLEDIAVEPIFNGPDLIWLGDIGDNEAREKNPEKPPRSAIQVVRIEEPVINPARVPISSTVPAKDIFVFTYPDEPHDAEAMAVDPITGDLYIFTKEQAAPSTIFRARSPLSSGVLERVATLDSTWLTGADFSPNGDELLIRNYRAASYWSRAADQTWDDVFNGNPVQISLKSDPIGGESIAFSVDASGFFSMAEGEQVPILYYGKSCATSR
jgi:hypothetical protein